MPTIKVESWRCKDESYCLCGAENTPEVKTEMFECETLLLAFEANTWADACQMHETLMAVDRVRLRCTEICRAILAHNHDMSAAEALSHVSDRI
jgi:hypothetical protein